MKNLLVSILMLFIGFGAYAQTSSCLGKWTTIDDKTNKKKSTVELYKENGKMYGKITYLYPREGRPDNAVCEKCTDDRKNKPLIGLQLVRNLEWDGSEWKGGTIVDPENGKVYKTKIWVDANDHNKLNVRGYLGPFYRTQTWIRVND